MKGTDFEQLIAQWHRDRNLIDGSTDKDQYMKLIQEAGELSDSLCKAKDIRDDIGDMMVVLINIMVRNNLTINECLKVAYNDIKDRKGKMIDGVFVKEGDSWTKARRGYEITLSMQARAVSMMANWIGGSWDAERWLAKIVYRSCTPLCGLRSKLNCVRA